VTVLARGALRHRSARGIIILRVGWSTGVMTPESHSRRRYSGDDDDDDDFDHPTRREEDAEGGRFGPQALQPSRAIPLIGVEGLAGQTTRTHTHTHTRRANGMRQDHTPRVVTKCWRRTVKNLSRQLLDTRHLRNRFTCLRKYAIELYSKWIKKHETTQLSVSVSNSKRMNLNSDN
jgi:hypothetical protein